MSSIRVKTKYNTEGPYGTLEENKLFAVHNNSCDYVTYYDEHGDSILTIPDTIDNNILDAILRLYVPHKENTNVLKEGIEHMNIENVKICKL